jgi:hypothetical protein
MNGNWTFGWEAVGAIFGILAFLGFIVAEWNKIKTVIPGFFVLSISFTFCVAVGFFIGQDELFWRIFALTIGFLFGVIFGGWISTSGVNGKIIFMLLIEIIAIIIGLQLAVLIK